MKQIETDILKPMILEHNQKKKQEKKQEKKKGKVSVKTDEVKEKKKRVNKKKEEEVKGEGEGEGEVKEKKKRVNKKKEEEVKEGVEVEVEVEVKEKKRGRKTKEQIVECKMDVNVNAGNSQEDQLAELVNQLTDPRDIGVDDLETILSNLEEGEETEEEEKKLPGTPRISDPVVPITLSVTKEKVQKKRAPKKNKD
jgi:hypothetical protein